LGCHHHTLVFAANPKYELLARNSLGEQVRSSLAVVDDEIFIRTDKHLWCIGSVTYGRFCCGAHLLPWVADIVDAPSSPIVTLTWT